MSFFASFPDDPVPVSKEPESDREDATDVKADKPDEDEIKSPPITDWASI